MTLEEFLKGKRTDVLEQWFTLILDSYPAEAASAFAKQKDPFANPMGSTIRRATTGIFDVLVEDANPQLLAEPIGELVKILAIQSFRPSVALANLFFLKRVVREVTDEQGFTPSFESFDTKVDHMVLLAFDAYMSSREKIADMRVGETKRALGKLLERAEIAVGVPGLQSETKDNVEVEANT